jgi:DNA polymerase-2
LDERIPVPNRYFGLFTDKSIKLRGIEARRRDTAPFITGLQMDILQRLAQVTDVSQINSWLPDIFVLLRRCLTDLHSGQIPIEKLLITQTLSREIEAYTTPSPAARAARQLRQAGKPRYPGQPIRFVYVWGVEGVYAWDLPTGPTKQQIDVKYYAKLMWRGAMTILQPLGVDEERLRALVYGYAWQRPLPLAWTPPYPTWLEDYFV